MAEDGRATEPGIVREVSQDRRPGRPAYQHRGDGEGGGDECADDDCERRLLGERDRSPADHGNLFQGARPLRAREQALTLMDAIRKMTLMPARRLEARVPAMKTKGRLRTGADADI